MHFCKKNCIFCILALASRLDHCKMNLRDQKHKINTIPADLNGALEVNFHAVREFECLEMCIGQN